MTDTAYPPFNEEMQCFVRTITYDFIEKAGVAHLVDGSCTDMSGSIRFFQNIDPDVMQIATLGGGERDTLYLKRDGKWQALFGKAA